MLSMIPHRFQERIKLRDIILNQIKNKEKQNYEQFLNFRRQAALSTLNNKSSFNIQIKKFRAKQAKIDITSHSFSKFISEKHQHLLSNQQKHQMNISEKYSHKSFDQNGLNGIVEQKLSEKKGEQQIPSKMISKQILQQNPVNFSSIPLKNRIQMQQSEIVRDSIQEQVENQISIHNTHNNLSKQNTLLILHSQNYSEDKDKLAKSVQSQGIRPFSIENLCISRTQKSPTIQSQNSSNHMMSEQSIRTKQNQIVKKNEDLMMDEDEI